MKTTAQNLQARRDSFIRNARQVQVEGVADNVAVGYVREYETGRVAYLVFYGKQGKPAKHFSAHDIVEAEQRIREALTAAGQAAERRAAERKQPRQPYHESTSGDVTTRSYSTAGTAQLIREALKEAFPGQKFSVTSSVYANGSSVRIEYTDGPSERQVKEVYAPFISGHYNSQEDMHEYHAPATVVDTTGRMIRESYGAKYISTSRNYSPAYGSFLNSLDLRECPSLAVQFTAFYEWHRCQRYTSRTSYGEQAGRFTLSSNSSHGDLERFAAALNVQGHAVRLSEAGDELTLTVTAASGCPPAAELPRPADLTPTVSQTAPVKAEAAQVEAPRDQTAAEFEAAEHHWLVQDNEAQREAAELEAAERHWLAQDEAATPVAPETWVDLYAYPVPEAPGHRHRDEAGHLNFEVLRLDLRKTSALAAAAIIVGTPAKYPLRYVVVVTGTRQEVELLPHIVGPR